MKNIAPCGIDSGQRSGVVTFTEVSVMTYGSLLPTAQCGARKAVSDMKCPNGKHHSYCPEEDSVLNEDTGEFECARCVMDELILLRAEKQATVLGDAGQNCTFGNVIVCDDAADDSGL